MRTEEKKKDILDVMKYRNGDHYVGSHASYVVCELLGISYQDMIAKGAFKKAIETARPDEIDNVWNYLANFIAYMHKHPLHSCSHCGNRHY